MIFAFKKKSKSKQSDVLLNIGFALAYIGTSGTLILYNASILKGVFPYPALLTAGREFMPFCTPLTN
jgi:hypothetical protein